MPTPEEGGEGEEEGEEEEEKGGGRAGIEFIADRRDTTGYRQVRPIWPALARRDVSCVVTS